MNRTELSNRADLEAIGRGYAGRRILCLTCMDVIQSHHRHHMCSCLCSTDDTRVRIDGGAAYTRMMVGKNARFIALDDIE